MWIDIREIALEITASMRRPVTQRGTKRTSASEWVVSILYIRVLH